MFQFGCFTAENGLIFLNLFIGKLRKGPPEAVINICSTLSLLDPFNNERIEKCSESTGIN